MRQLQQFVTTWFGVVCILSWVIVHASGQEPELTRLFPSGGKRGNTFEVVATGKFPTWPVQVACDDPGIQWKPAEESGKFQVTILENAQLGCTGVRFYTEKGATAKKPFCVGSFLEGTEQETNDSPRQANALPSMPIIVNGVLEKNADVDVFAVELQAGQTLVASLIANEQLESPVDATLELLDEKQFVLDQNLDRHGLDPQITFAIPRSGRYYVRVFGMPSTPDSSIRFSGKPEYVYRLLLTQGPFVEQAEPSALASDSPANVIAVGVNCTSLSSVRIPLENLKSKSSYRIEFSEASSSLELPVVSTPVIVATGESSRENPQSIPVPSCVHGTLGQRGQEHVFRFESKAGTQWSIRAESHQLHSAMDPVLFVLNEKGDVLSTQDDKSKELDPTLDWKCSADGKYSIVVRDLYRSASPLHYYRLTISNPVPGYSASLSSDLIKGTVGKPIEVEVTLDRNNGFSEEIELGIATELAGLNANAVISEAKGDSAKKVKLQLVAMNPVQNHIELIAKNRKTGEAQPVLVSGKNKPIWLSVVAEK